MTRRGWVLFLVMCVVWGVPYLMIRVAVREVSPATLVFLRSGAAALLLLPLAGARGELRLMLPRWRPLLAFALVEIALPWLALASAERRVSSSLAALLIAAVPFTGVAIATLTRSAEQFDGRRIAGLAVGVGGVAAIVGFDISHTSGVGLVEMAAVVVGYAAGPWILSRYLAGLPNLGVIAVSLGASALLYLPVAAVQFPHTVPSSHVVLSIVGLAVLCTALAFVLFFELIAEAGPVRATVITYVNPAVAALLGIAVLNEHFTAGMGFGFALVLVGSVLATAASRRRAVAEP
ncbi:MAG TPA: DMT family transporter [Gaiellaceae bacterium]|jgi:drug/metabolite transporter (DMT)-like permease